jgi:hypothetical protein
LTEDFVSPGKNVKWVGEFWSKMSPTDTDKTAASVCPKPTEQLNVSVADFLQSASSQKSIRISPSFGAKFEFASPEFFGAKFEIFVVDNFGKSRILRTALRLLRNSWAKTDEIDLPRKSAESFNFKF